MAQDESYYGSVPDWRDEYQGEVRNDDQAWYIDLANAIGDAVGFPRAPEPGGPNNAPLETLMLLSNLLTGAGLARGSAALGADALGDLAMGVTKYPARLAEQTFSEALAGATPRKPTILRQPRGEAAIPEVVYRYFLEGNESPRQSWLRELYNQGLARHNMGLVRSGVPPVPMQGPNAPQWAEPMFRKSNSWGRYRPEPDDIFPTTRVPDWSMDIQDFIRARRK